MSPPKFNKYYPFYNKYRHRICPISCINGVNFNQKNEIIHFGNKELVRQVSIVYLPFRISGDYLSSLDNMIVDLEGEVIDNRYFDNRY